MFELRDPVPRSVPDPDKPHDELSSLPSTSGVEKPTYIQETNMGTYVSGIVCLRPILGRHRAIEDDDNEENSQKSSSTNDLTLAHISRRQSIFPAPVETLTAQPGLVAPETGKLRAKSPRWSRNGRKRPY